MLWEFIPPLSICHAGRFRESRDDLMATEIVMTFDDFTPRIDISHILT